MIGGVIFDLDGTILDSMSIWDSAAELYLDSLGITAEAGLGKIMFSMNMAEGALFLKDRYHLDIAVDEIIAGINRTIENFYYYQVQLKEGVEQFLKGMKQAGVKMVIATASDRHIVEKALERLNIMNYFDRIFTCTEIGAGKIKPDIYLAAAEYMGTLPKDTWVFEDALYAIQAAKNAGFKTVGVYDPYSADEMDEIKMVSDIYLNKLDNIHIFLEKASC
jgi:HAD superfamily hydrolase (TIGR01509 family)